LHHGLAEGVVVPTLVSYGIVFFAIYWAWVNFTWFASAYDTDDLAHRAYVFVTMAGALILAAGVPAVFGEHRDARLVVDGYSVMRVALIVQWVRVARDDPTGRPAARRFAIGLTIVQVAWIGSLALPGDLWVVAWCVLAAGELAVPMWGEHAGPTPWNPEHIAERYGLFMIIVLGESVLAASRAIQTALAGAHPAAVLGEVVVGGLLVVFAIWWISFDPPAAIRAGLERRPFVWSYLHLVVFAAVAAVGAGLALSIEGATAGVALGPTATGAAVAVPGAAFLASRWAMVRGAAVPAVRAVGLPLAVVGVLVAPLTPAPVLVVGLLLATLAVVMSAADRRSRRVRRRA